MERTHSKRMLILLATIIEVVLVIILPEQVLTEILLPVLLGIGFSLENLPFPNDKGKISKILYLIIIPTPFILVFVYILGVNASILFTTGFVFVHVYTRYRSKAD